MCTLMWSWSLIAGTDRNPNTQKVTWRLDVLCWSSLTGWKLVLQSGPIANGDSQRLFSQLPTHYTIDMLAAPDCSMENKTDTSNTAHVHVHVLLPWTSLRLKYADFTCICTLEWRFLVGAHTSWPLSAHWEGIEMYYKHTIHVDIITTVECIYSVCARLKHKIPSILNYIWLHNYTSWCTMDIIIHIKIYFNSLYYIHTKTKHIVQLH